MVDVKAVVLPNGRFISYLRVSTARQGASGLGLQAQRESVERYLNGGNWTVIDEILEVESGKRNDRPAIAEAIMLCRLHNATLVIARLDRLARNVRFISSLMESGIEFIACDLPGANRFTLHILASVAEYEATLISQRTKAALAAAKVRGVKLGGQRGPVSRMKSIALTGHARSVAVRRKRASERADDLLPVITRLRDEGCPSLNSIAKALNRNGLKTSGGKQWSATQVGRVLQRRLGDDYRTFFEVVPRGGSLSTMA